MYNCANVIPLAGAFTPVFNRFFSRSFDRPVFVLFVSTDHSIAPDSFPSVLKNLFDIISIEDNFEYFCVEISFKCSDSVFEIPYLHPIISCFHNGIVVDSFSDPESSTKYLEFVFAHERSFLDAG